MSIVETASYDAAIRANTYDDTYYREVCKLAKLVGKPNPREGMTVAELGRYKHALQTIIWKRGGHAT